VQLNLIENVQREELSGVEKGRVCKFLLENYPDKYPTPTTIAKKVGVNTDTITLWLRTVEIIPRQVQKLVAPATVSGEVPEGKIDYQTALKIGRSIKEPEKQVEIIKKLAAKHLPVRERMQIIKKAVDEPEKPLEQVFEEASVETPYELEFAAEDKASILNGLKTQTSRLDAPDPKVKADATVQAVVWEPHFADLRIVSIERKRLKYFDDEDAKREGGYTLKQFKQLWKETHGEWDEGQLVYVIRFEKVK
jgi:ParB-like chromosome segregation protein Spo0J